jgi:Transposase DDE domain group 1
LDQGFVSGPGDRHPRKQITLDLDATDDPLHGHQEGRFFHSYYDGYCYLALYIFWRPASAGGKAAARQHGLVRCRYKDLRHRPPTARTTGMQRITITLDDELVAALDRVIAVCGY